MTPSHRCAAWGRSAATELKAFLADAVDLALPARCGACGRRAEGVLCATCRGACRPPAGPACPRCGQGWEPGSSCRRCARHGRGFAFDGAAALWRYQGPVRRLVHAFKFGGRRDVLAVLGRELARAPRVRALVPRGGVPLVVPVPAHAAARRRRGYDQARLLAAGLADASGWEPAPRALLRRREPPGAQSVLSGPARRAAMRAAFAVRDRRVGGRAVVVVDDVLSTGATADACALALRRAGAGPVAVAVLAT